MILKKIVFKGDKFPLPPLWVKTLESLLSMADLCTNSNITETIQGFVTTNVAERIFCENDNLAIVNRWSLFRGGC